MSTWASQVGHWSRASTLLRTHLFGPQSLLCGEQQRSMSLCYCCLAQWWRKQEHPHASITLALSNGQLGHPWG